MTDLRPCCQHCRSTYTFIGKGSPVDGARVAGWIIWSGTTQDGRHVERTYCPRCAGKPVIDPTTGEEPSWDAECHTCSATMAEEWGDDHEGALTKNDAEQWRSEHFCYPDVTLIPPTREVAA